ncbi:MAG: hypothetical protein JNK66_00185 [Chitinophagales bacterium]|nr:hypothetical protein [Chitinophagales bacterium]
MNYKVRFSQTYKLVAIMIGLPILVVPLFVMLGTEFGDLPDWLIIVAIVVMMVLMIVSVLLLVKKFQPRVEVRQEPDGFFFTFIDTGLVAPANFQLRISDLKNFWTDEAQGNLYFSVESTQKPHKFHISPVSKGENDLAEYYALVSVFEDAVNRQNESKDAPQITSTSMYETWWAKLLAIIFVLLMVAVFVVPVVFSEMNIPWYRGVYIFAVGLPFVWQVYIKNFKK